MLSQNRTGKYLLYAIGEIVLVVIGILIALSVNNWNEGQKRNDNRITLLQNIKMDALATGENMEIVLDLRKDILKKRKLYLEYASRKDSAISLDSLSYYMNWQGIKSVEKWPILTTYEASLSSGEIGLLQNRELLQALNILQIRNHQRIKMADYHFQSELLFGIRDFRKKFGSTEFFSKKESNTNYVLMHEQKKLRSAYYDEETYATIATEYDIWANQIKILDRIDKINDSILVLLNQQLKK